MEGLTVILTKFEISGWQVSCALLEQAKKEDRYDTDIPTLLIAKVFEEHKIDLIDIQSLGSSTESSLGKCLIKHQTIGCLSMRKPTNMLIADIWSSLVNHGATLDYKETVLNAPQIEARVFEGGGLVTKKVPIESSVPRLSDGPLDGKYTSSWNNALSTDEAKQWVKDHGIDVDTIRTIGITSDDGEHTIGFPQH
jgi:hypothetical protein